MTVPSSDGDLCYLIVSHTEPDLVERLVGVLAEENPGASVLVRHDRTRSTFEASRLDGLPGAHLLDDATSAAWGSWALTSATLRAVRAALEQPGWRWLVLLSGSSYPVRPLGETAQALRSTTEGAWMALAPPREQSAARRRDWRPFDADRARYRYLKVPYSRWWERESVRRPLLSLTGRQPFVGTSFQVRGEHHPRLTPRMTVLRPRSVFRGEVRPVRASQWWAVSRDAAQVLVELLDTTSRWNREFRDGYMSDETAPASFLTASGVDVLDRATHAVWWPSGPSPALLTEDHLQWLEQRREPFARKVSLATPAMLDALDRRRREQRDG